MNSKGRILVVDDDRLVLAMLTHGLSQAGYQVIDADNGDDAILLARKHKPEFALLDIRMEGKSGFDVAAYLSEYCQIPFMFLSAFSDEATLAQVKALGAVAYLVKPLDIKQIVPAVEAAFANLRSNQARGFSVDASGRSLEANAAEGVQPHSALTLADGAPLPAEVAMAVGLLMHRYSLARAAAWARLQRLATIEGRTVQDQADRLLDALELLSKPAEL